MAAEFKVTIKDTDLGLEEAMQWWKGLEQFEVVAGILEKDAFELTAPTESNKTPEITLITKAVVQEFGSRGKWGKGKRIPQRAPLRKGLMKAKPKIKTVIQKSLSELKDNRSTILPLLGSLMVMGIIKAIHEHPRAISKHTIDNKGHATILKDTNQLFNAYKFEVRRKRG